MLDSSLNRAVTAANPPWKMGIRGSLPEMKRIVPMLILVFGACVFPRGASGTPAYVSPANEELQVSRDVWLLNALAAEKGRDSALDWFKDGAGYALAARVWVPFVSPSRAFVLYLCWEQANLNEGEDCVFQFTKQQP